MLAQADLQPENFVPRAGKADQKDCSIVRYWNGKTYV